MFLLRQLRLSQRGLVLRYTALREKTLLLARWVVGFWSQGPCASFALTTFDDGAGDGDNFSRIGWDTAL